MREILFRGKNTDDDEWAYGSFVMDAMEQMKGKNDGEDGFIRYYDKEKHKMVTEEVQRETVCQYTGLTDKNGRKIFEGDILHFANHLINHEWLCVIEFIQGNFACRSIEKDGTLGGFSQFSSWNENEIVGNVFDNPELIGDQP